MSPMLFQRCYRASQWLLIVLLLVFSESQMTQVVDTTVYDYVSWSPDGSKIGIASADGFLSIWDAQNLSPIVTIDVYTGSPNEAISDRYEFAWSPDGAYIVTGGDDGFARIWDVADGRPITTLMQDGEAVTGIDWSEDGSLIAGTRVFEQGFVIWDAVTEKQISYGLTDSSSIAFSPDLRTVALGRVAGIGLFDVRSGEYLYNLPEQPGGSSEITDFIGTVVWSPDSQYLFGFRYNNTIEVWDVDSRQFMYSFENPGLSVYSPVSIDFDLVSGTFSLVGRNGILQTRALETGNPLGEVQVIPADQASALSPYGGRLAVIAAQAGRAVSETLPEIIIPVISVERVRGIARRCLADADNLTSAVTSVLNDVVINSLTKLTLPAFVRAIEALSVNAIPAACSADLVAVADAVIGGE